MEERQLTLSISGHGAGIRHWLDTATSSPPSILALHGFTGSGLDFLPLQSAVGSGFDWICPDFIGHGSSDCPDIVDPYRLPSVLRLIDAARSLARDPDQIYLLGYSMGGRLALHYLRSASPLPVFLIGASPGLQTAEERSLRRRSDHALIKEMDAGMESFCRKWEAQSLIEPQTRLAEPLRQELAERRRQNRMTGLRNTLEACGAGSLPSLWPILGGIGPLHYLHGSRDHKFADIGRQMFRANPAMTIIPVPDAGHAPHLEQPGLVAQVLRNFAANPQSIEKAN